MTRILILDDDLAFARDMEQFLTRKGFAVEIATCMEDARRLLETASVCFDILLIDHRLGADADGIDLIGEFKQLLPDCDPVLFTGIDDYDIGQRAYAAGATRYLRKDTGPAELLHILHEIEGVRTTRFERRWLETLTEVLEEAQQTLAVPAMAHVLAAGACRLGFARSRLYQLEIDANDQLWLTGLAQQGMNFPVFAGQRWPVAATYAQHVLNSDEGIVVFRGLELGRRAVQSDYMGYGNQPPLGEWVGVTLRSDGNNIGVLMLDNDDQMYPVRPELLKLLRLLARQAAAALNRALHFEAEQIERRADEIMSAIVEELNEAPEPSLDELLRTVQIQMEQAIPHANLIVAFHHEQWLCERWHMESRAPLPIRWYSSDDKDLITHVYDLYVPSQSLPGIWLPRDVAAYRQTQGIKQVGTKPAISWMGSQLRVGSQPIGVIALEDDDQEDAFSSADFWLLSRLCARLGGLLHTYWLDELRAELASKLATLQTAGEDLMLLANSEDGEYRLWHATLTMGTAHYGLGFNRAVLFFFEKSGQCARVYLGIGHLNPEAAHAAWEAEGEAVSSFEEYQQQLQANTLTPTGIEVLARQREWVLACDAPASALSELYLKGSVIQLTSDQSVRQLPKSLVSLLGAHAYSLVPVKAGTRTLGFVILDMAFTKAPHRRELLGYFDVLTNQSALIYENLQRDRQLEALVEVTYRSLSSTASEPLVDILNNIARSAQELMKADLVSIYPVRSTIPLTFDVDNVGMAGQDRKPIIPEIPKSDGFTARLLGSREIVVVEDVTTHTERYHGRLLVEHPFIVAEGIRSLIAAPVLGVRYGTQRGVLYLDFREPHAFTERDRKVVRTFAQLAALAIRQSREFSVLEEELLGLGDVLELALKPETKRSELIGTAIRTLRRLFQLGRLHIVLSLLEWERDETSGQPRLTRRQYYLDHRDLVGSRTVTENIYRGLSGVAMQTSQQQVAQDVRADKLKDIFYDTGIGTQAEIDTPIMTSDGQVQGVLTVESPNANVFEGRHAETATRFAAAIGLIVESLRRHDQMRRVLEAADDITAPAEVETSLQAISHAIQKTAPDISTLTIWYLHPDTRQLSLGTYFGVKDVARLRRERPGAHGIVQKIMQRVEPIFAEDAMQYPVLRNSGFFKREGFTSVAAFPLRAQDHRVGAMFFSYRSTHLFSKSERTLFTILAQIVAANIQEALLLQQVNEENRHHRALIKVTEIIGNNLELDKTVQHILQSLHDLFPKAVPCLLTYNADDEHLHFAPGVREVYRPSDGSDLPASLALDHSSIAGCLAMLSQEKQRKLMVNIGDIDECGSAIVEGGDEQPGQPGRPRISFGDFPGVYLRLRRRTRSQFSVTLYNSNDTRLVGVLVLESEQDNAFDEQDIFSLWGIAKQIRFAIERAQQTMQLRRKEIIASATAWAADIAHDINRETGILHHRIYELRKEPALTQNAQGYLDELEQSAFRLAGVTAPTGWRSAEVDAPVNLPEVLEQLATRQIQKRAAEVELIIHRPEYEPVLVNASRDALALVVRNLVRNALEAMSGQVDQHLTFTIDAPPKEKGVVNVIIADSGPGINDASIRQNVFGLPVSSHGEGRGFGLLLVQDALERLGGSIRLLPYTEGRGAEFEITLPIYSGNKLTPATISE